MTCPKCNKELSRHSYEYTHSKFCKGKPDKPTPVEEEEEEEDEGVKEITKKMEQMTITELIEETKPTPKPVAEPEPVIVDIEEVPKAKPKAKPKPKPQPQPSKYQEITPEYVPTDDDILRYLRNIRKEKAMKKQQGYDRMMSAAF